MAKAALALAEFRAPKGRGERFTLAHAGGPFTLIDESYNANPASMRAALDLLARTPPAGRGRRIAVLGDMLELGADGAHYHAALVDAVEASTADLVLLAGPAMRDLWHVLPQGRRAAYAEDAAELTPILLETIGPGDVVMLKASHGIGLAPLVDALRRRFAAPAE
jgi:UDP-N-acetylmuramyl pentapeptide synthase